MRNSPRRSVRSATRSSVSVGFPDPPLEPIVPAASEFHYRNKLEYSFTTGEDGIDLGFHRAGRWDEVIGIEECLLTTELGNAIRLAVREWAREERLDAYDQESGDGISPPPRRPRGAEHGSGARRARHGAGRALRGRLLRRRAPPLSGGAIDPLGDQRHAGRADEPADQAALGGGRDRGGDPRADLPRPSLCIPPDEYEMAERLYELAREYAALTGDENVYDLYCGTGTIGLALAGTRTDGVGARDLGGVGRVRDRERRAERDRERERFFAGNVGQTVEELRERGGQPDVVVVDPRGPGWRARRCDDRRARRAADRLRLVQPDDARIATCRCCATSTDTSSSAAGRWTCSPTRRTSSRSRRSGRARQGAIRSRSHVSPEQVRVRGEEAERDRRQRREPADVTPRPDEHQGRGRADASSRSTSRRPAAGSEPRQRGRARRRGRPAGRGSGSPCSPGVGNATATSSKISWRCSTTYWVGPAATDQMSTHGHEHRDEHEPPKLLEERQEAEADQRKARELRDVRPPSPRRARSDQGQGLPRRARGRPVRATAPSERKREPDRGGEHAGNRTTRDGRRRRRHEGRPGR